MSRRPAQAVDLVIGGRPHVNLLPDEVRVAERGARQRRGMIALVVVSVVLALAGFGAAKVVSVSAELELAAAEARTAELLRAQSEFAEVRALAAERQALVDAQTAGALSEIPWTSRLAEVQAALPDGAVIIGMTLDGGDPMVPYPPSTVAFAVPATAMMTFTAATPDLPRVSAWLDRLSETVTGFAGAAPGGVSWSDELQVYTASVSVALDAKSWSGRHLPENVVTQIEQGAIQPSAPASDASAGNETGADS